MWSRFRDKIVRMADRQRVRGKNRVNSLNELLLSSKEIPIFCRTYRDLSHKDFLISFHPFSIGDVSWQRALFCGALGLPQEVPGGRAAARPGGLGDTADGARANGLVSKQKVCFQ